MVSNQDLPSDSAAEIRKKRVDWMRTHTHSRWHHDEVYAKINVEMHYFVVFPRSSKRLILEWIANAKCAATRSKQIEESPRLASPRRQTIRANHFRQPKASLAGPRDGRDYNPELN